MGQVVVDMSVSLDEFVAGPRDRFGRPLGEGGKVRHRWLFAGERLSRYSHFFRLAEADREILDATFSATGALVVGRRTYDVVEG